MRAPPPDSPRALAELPGAAPDAALLRRDRANYARATGTQPTFLDLGDGDLGVHYPEAADGARVGAAWRPPAAVVERPLHRDRIHALGFGLEGGALRIVPTPATFRARLRRLGIEAPVRPALRSTWGKAGAGGSRELLAGVFPIPVLHGLVASLGWLGGTASTLCRDLGYHLLPLTFLPRRRWSEVVQTAASSLGAGAASEAVSTWTRGPLTRACWDAWARAERPEEVAPLLMEGWEPLLGRLGESTS